MKVVLSKQLAYFIEQLQEHFPDSKIDLQNWRLSEKWLLKFSETLKVANFAFSGSQRTCKATFRTISWYQALRELAKNIPDNSVLLFDELQWMSNYRSELISILKSVWDKYLSGKENLMVVLCGSVASFMINKVLKSRALYGRSSLAIHLKPFKLKSTREFLSEKSTMEALSAQMLVGGIPGYLELLKNQNSVYLGIQELAFQEHGYFITEYDRIFTSQFGKS